jgi:hypothetical protein
MGNLPILFYVTLGARIKVDYSQYVYSLFTYWGIGDILYKKVITSKKQKVFTCLGWWRQSGSSQKKNDAPVHSFKYLGMLGLLAHGRLIESDQSLMYLFYILLVWT